MGEFRAFTPSPARIHDRARALIGHHPAWLRRPFTGGLFSTEHFRICSYCRCIHPGDMIELLEQGGSTFASSDKPGRFLFTTPNPIAGDLVRMGSVQGPVFSRNDPPFTLRERLRWPVRAELEAAPEIAERLTGHFERPHHEPAPAMIRWFFYAEHTTDQQWPEIWAAASRGPAALLGT